MIDPVDDGNAVTHRLRSSPSTSYASLIWWNWSALPPGASGCVFFDS